MVLMKYFCFWFPVRLGVLIISGLSILANFIPLAFFLMETPEDLKMKATSITQEFRNTDADMQDKEIYELFFETVRDYPEEFRYAGLGFTGSFLIACILNILSALSLYRWLSFPYIILGLVYFAIAFTAHVSYMLYMKKEWNLGMLIAACCIGGFILLYCLYLISVTIAMFQMIGVVNSKEYRELLLKNAQKNRKMPPVSNFVDRKNTKNFIISPMTPYENPTYPIQMLASDFAELQRKRPFRRI